MAQFVSLAQAVKDNLNNGDTVAFEGFTHLIPYAAGHEAIRQGFRDLTLIRMTPDVLYDQMVGMGMAKKMIFSYVGNPGVGLLRRVRDAIENGFPNTPEIEEHSHAGDGQWPTRRAPPTCRSRCSAATRARASPAVNPNIKIDHLSLHRRGAGRRSRRSAPT